MKFAWRNPLQRQLCVNRIHNLVKCKQLDLDKAVLQALYQVNGNGSFRYCKNPEFIGDGQLHRLKMDADRLIRGGARREGRAM